MYTVTASLFYILCFTDHKNLNNTRLGIPSSLYIYIASTYNIYSYTLQLASFCV